MFGTDKMKMAIKKEEGQKTLNVKFTKVVDATMFNLITIIYETDLYTSWFPFCYHSTLVLLDK